MDYSLNCLVIKPTDKNKKVDIHEVNTNFQFIL